MSTFYIHEGTRYFEGAPFTYNGINYTHEGATDETFTSLGFKKVNSDPRPDDRFYVVNSYPNDEGHWDVQERDLEELKKDAIRQAKSTAGTLLSESDWYIVRHAETGKAVPEDVKKYRSAVRAVETKYEHKVQGITTLKKFIGLDEPDWPSTEEQHEIPVSE